MKFSKKKSYEIAIGPYPFEVYYSPSKKAWDSLMKEWGPLYQTTEYQRPGIGMCTRFDFKGEPTRCVITFDAENVSKNQILGIIVHESTHAVDYLIERIGEEYPGKEFRAYTTQWITQTIYHIWKGLE
jgi:hypothetical protein